MGLLDQTSAARIERLEAEVSSLINAMWALRTDSQLRSTGVLSQEAIAAIRNAADLAGIDL